MKVKVEFRDFPVRLISGAIYALPHFVVSLALWQDEHVITGWFVTAAFILGAWARPCRGVTRLRAALIGLAVATGSYFVPGFLGWLIWLASCWHDYIPGLILVSAVITFANSWWISVPINVLSAILLQQQANKGGAVILGCRTHRTERTAEHRLCN